MTDIGVLPFEARGRIDAAAAPSLSADHAKTLRFDLADTATLGAHRAAWDDLAANAIEPNLFCEADFALAAQHLKAVRKVRFAVVWDDGPTPRLLAAVPVVSRRILPFHRVLASTQWAYFGALGTPLVDRERAVEAIDALLTGLAAQGDAVLQFRFLHERGPAAGAIRAALALSGRAMTQIDGHARALLLPGTPAEAYLTASLSSKKLKELRRQLRRLADDAPVAFREAREPRDLADALERFVDLEAKGWKGQNGSALRAHADHLAFMRALFSARAAKGEARVLELMVGEATVASGLVLTSGRAAWYYKIAYDEAHARCSPGVQLTLELTRRLIEDPAIDTVDSTAIADHPMIDHIWRERLELGDWMIATRPGAAPWLAVAVRSDHLRRRARTVVRDLYHRVKGHVR